METKKCSNCGNEYEINFFQIRNETGKRRNQCKFCINAFHRKLYLEKVGKFKREIRAENRESDPKRCIRCKKIKPLSDFNIHNHKKGQHRNFCKQCQAKWSKKFNRSRHGKELREVWQEKNKDKIIQYRELYKNDPGKRAQKKTYLRERWLREHFNMTSKEYDDLLQKQDGKCAICGKEKPYVNGDKHFPIDHNSQTGKVRGLLCHNCNVGIGNFQHSVELLTKAIEYLRRFD